MIRSILRGILAPAVVAVALLTAVTSPAEAASCVGDGCSGKNPATYCPSGAVSKHFKTFNSGGTEVGWYERYHSGCKAAWVRVNLHTGDVTYEPRSFQGRIQSKRKPKGESAYVVSTQTSAVIKANGFGQSKSINSLMVPMNPGTVKATSRYCWRWTANNGSWNGWTCSGWS